MRAHWLIETGVFADTAARVTAALEARGQPWTRYEDGMPDVGLPPAGACVLFWGSLGAAYQARVAARWTPGAIGAIERFTCSAYYARFAPLLANADAVFTTAEGLARDAGAVLAALGHAERVFVRPDSPQKPFSGRTLAAGAITLEALDHGFYYDDASLPVVVSRHRSIGREWRTVVADGAVVAGCEYGSERRGRAADLPDGVREVAARVATADWQPAPIYVVDVAEVDGELRVMELNPFSGADLYLCDADAVVEAASGIAERLHGASPG